MILHHAFKRYAWTVLAGIALAVGGSVCLRNALTPSVIALPARNIHQIAFSTNDPAQGWMIATLRHHPVLYRTTNRGRDWHPVPGISPRFSLGIAGTKMWVPIRTDRHDKNLAYFPNQYALAYFPTISSPGTVEPVNATPHSTGWKPWSVYDALLLPQQSANPFHTFWLLAESPWNPGTGLFTLFHWNSKHRQWTAVAPVPLGVRGDDAFGITITGPHTLWWSSGGNGTLAQLDRVTITHHHATVQAVTLPGWPENSPCSSGGTVLTDRRVGVPAFSGPDGRVMASWTGCQANSVVHLQTWATVNGGQSWHPTGTMPPGAVGGRWASSAMGYAWSMNQRRWWITTDGGRQWVATAQIQTLDVVTPQNLWVVAGNRLLHSTDAGVHWIPVRVDVLT